MAIGRVGVRPYSGGTSTTTTTSGLDTDAQAFITATTLTDTTQINAINDLVLDLKGAGIWTKMKALYPMVGGTATTHKFNLKDPRDLDTAYRLTFYGGVTHNSSGILGNGVDGYADTFLTMTTAYSAPYDVHLSTYIYNDWTSTGAAQAHIGASITGGLYRIEANSNVLVQSTLGGASINKTVTATTHKGFYCAAIESTSKRRTIFADNVFTNNTITATANLPTGTINLMVRKGTGISTSSYSAFGYSFFSAGNKLTTLEQQVFSQIVEKYQYALGRNVGATKSFYFNKDYSNETNSFIYKGEISDSVQMSAINTLVNDLKTAGIFTKMKAIYPIVGGTATSHQLNLVTPAIPSAYGTTQNDMFTMTFNGGWTHTTNGATPNGTTGYANTNLTPSDTLSLNSSHISYYIRNNINANQVPIGTISDSSTRYSFFYPRLSNTISGTINASTNSISITNILDSLGLHTFSRTSSTSVTFSKNLTQYVRTQNSSALPTRSFFIGACNNNSSSDFIRIAYYSTHECAFASIGDGLTDAEATTFYNAVQAFQTTLGRQV